MPREHKSRREVLNAIREVPSLKDLLAEHDGHYDHELDLEVSVYGRNYGGKKVGPYLRLLTYEPGGALAAPFGVMGGFMQPQGHMQVMCNIADFGLNAQEALDAPRFRVDDGAAAGIEPGVPEAVRAELSARGHQLTVSPWWSPAFGRGQVVAVDRESGAIVAGSEPRSDGCAVGW